MLKIHKLTKRYGKKTILDELDFEVNKDEIVFLLGKNGAGKTTLYDLISGITVPDEGEIKINGISINDDVEKYKNKIAYIPHYIDFLEYLTVEEFIEFFKRLLNIKDNTLVDEYFDKFSLTEYMKEQINKLSAGNKQKVSIMANLLGSPDVIIFDEPFNALDIEACYELKRLIFEKLYKNKVILITTHTPEIIEESDTHKLAILHEGKIVECDNIKNIINKYGGIVEAFKKVGYNEKNISYIHN